MLQLPTLVPGEVDHRIFKRDLRGMEAYSPRFSAPKPTFYIGGLWVTNRRYKKWV